jgi:hypothetical protein
MAVTSQVYFASDERWYVQYVSRIGEVERQWTRAVPLALAGAAQSNTLALCAPPNSVLGNPRLLDR